MTQRNSYRASRPNYVHGSAAPDLRPANPDVNVFAGKGRSAETSNVPSSIVSAFRVGVVVAIVVAVLCCARVGLAAANISATIATSELSSQIEAQRTTGNDLEVQQSQLSNSMHIRIAAEGLGMAAPAATEAVVLSEDVIATDASGNLSLSASLSSMASQG